MSDKDQNLVPLSSESLHENNLTTYNTLDTESAHPFTSSKRPVFSTSGEKKTPKHIFSATHEVSEEASNLSSKKTTREASRLLDQANNYNIDVTTSTYALQIALKNMKERYQRLQKKITVLEEENGRLINGKSELFNEIGKMQESSIKLREKNLQLNHEVHSKHQECCSLHEQFSTMSNENLRLTSQLSQSTAETKKLNKEIEGLTEENALLKEGIEEILSQCQKFPSLPSEFLSRVEKIGSRSLKTPQNLNFSTRTKILPSDDHFEIIKNFEKVMNFENFDSEGIGYAFDEAKDVDSQSTDALLKARDAMQKVQSMLQIQNQQLSDLKPLMVRVCKRKLDSSDVEDSGGDPCRNYLSRFATCSSARPLSVEYLNSDEPIESGPIVDSGGETNVLVEEVEEQQNCRQVPFDWREVEVSEDDDDASETIHRPPPTTRTVSTSPDLTLTFDGIDEGQQRTSRELSSEEDRTCPMCNAVFPLLLPQETFESHVVSHFEVENGYEVIT